MPLGNAHEQPYRRRVLFSDREIRAMTAYVASLSAGPAVPRPQPQRGNLAQGLQLFTEHCAGCHQVVAEGGFVPDARVPPIKQDSPTEIAEAVRVGPYVMPKLLRQGHLEEPAEFDHRLRRRVEAAGRPRRLGDRPHRPGTGGTGRMVHRDAALVATCVVIGKRLRS